MSALAATTIERRGDPVFAPYFRPPEDAIERESLLARIGVAEGVRSGQPIIRGMRVTVRDVLEWVASGVTPDELVAEWPWMEVDDVRAAILWVAAS